jgi:hypothetical protein
MSIGDTGRKRGSSGNPKRFEELVLYIAERTTDDPEFGSTKTAKVLYHSDVEAYRELGESITGTEYQAWERGPYPPALKGARQLLKASGRAMVQRGAQYEADRIIPTTKRPADLAAVGITREQAAIVDRWIKRVEKLSSNEVSRRSHKDPGWRVAAKDGVMPMDNPIELDDAAFLADRAPSQDDLKAAKRMARERGWLAGSRWQRG